VNDELSDITRGFVFAVEPIVNISTGQCAGVEVLAIKSPYWAHARWRAWYAALPDIVNYVRRVEGLKAAQYVAINVDSDQITDRYIYSSLCKNDENTVLEWTERLPKHWKRAESLIKRAAAGLERLRKEKNLRISFDDFGSGIDGYQRLGLLEPDYIKIDGNVLHGARTNGRHMYLLKHMVNLANDMRVKTVVEWVETQTDRHLVAASGADCAQGYFFGRREYGGDGLIAEKPSIVNV